MQWLAAQDSSAILQGTGLLDGQEGYHFRLWVTDGNPDLLRVRIWTVDASRITRVIYDNLSPQPVQGSLQVH